MILAIPGGLNSAHFDGSTITGGCPVQ